MLRNIVYGLVGAFFVQFAVNSSAKAIVFWPVNGNFYDFIPGKISWEEAKTESESLTFQGVSGHLATITSPLEDTFLLDSFGLIPNVWIGASDAEEEGLWKWVTGPETGLAFWSGGPKGSGGMPIDGAYENWNNGEPNNTFLATGEQEDFGVWNQQVAVGANLERRLLNRGKTML